MMKNYLTFLFLLLSCFTVSSQKKDIRYSNLQSDFFYGLIIEHDSSLDEAIQGNGYGLLLSYNKVSEKNTKFNSLYNYPERGYSFIYENFNSTILGEAFGAYRHYTYNLTPSKKNHLKLTTGFGVGYATKPYDEIDNNKNFAIGSHFLASAYFKFQYIQLFKDNNISLNSAISIIHFSNMSFKNPNLGINTMAFNIGVNYKLEPVEISKTDAIFSTDKSLKYHLIFRGGYNQSKVIGSDLYPFFTATFELGKNINQYSAFTGGVEYFNAQFLKEYSKHINIEEGQNYPENNASRVGIFIGHELLQNNFAFITQIGFYIYQPVPYESKVYERFGFHYKLSKHLFAEVSLKVNLFRAEALEFGLGYTF